MKRLTCLLLIIAIELTAQKKITLQELWGDYQFLPVWAEGFNVMKDGVSYVEEESDKEGVAVLNRYDMKSGKKAGTLVNGSDIRFGDKTLGLKGYKFSPGEGKLLLFQDAEKIYRHSSKANYFIHDIASKKTVQLSAKGKQILPKFSPDGKKIAYVQDNNIFIKTIDKDLEAKVTNDGAINKIKNGWADWVYEEEFSKPDYFCWSADSRYLAFVKFDESKVKDFTLEYYRGNLYPDSYRYKYPKAGEDNSVVSVHIYDMNNGKVVTADIGTETDIYIPRIDFTNDPGTLCIQRMNRLQNRLEFLFADASTGKTRIVLSEESATYIDITDNLTFVGSKGFIISSESDGYNHLYFHDLNGKLISQITKGEWDVMEFKGYDEATGLIYYTSTENGPINLDVYSVKTDGTGKKRLSQKEGHTDFEFTRGYKYYISTYSNANTPPVYELHSIDGKLIKVLSDNAALAGGVKSLGLTPKKFIKVPSASGYYFNAWIKLPQGFDSTKKYPVFMYAYNGPGSILCKNAWDPFDYIWHSILNQEGYIVVCVDGRGTGGRGREFRHCTYMQLGRFETEDQTESANYLKTFSYVDGKRIGFMGWSYGGYMASLMLCKSPDVIKTAVAVAPVTNWKYYDNIYTERFLRKPADNIPGYENNSPVNFVKNIKGNLLLIHGSSDDNVHVQNSMELAAELVKNNIPFEYMVYPNKSHGISGGLTRLHIYTKILKFVKDNL